MFVLGAFFAAVLIVFFVVDFFAVAFLIVATDDFFALIAGFAAFVVLREVAMADGLACSPRGHAFVNDGEALEAQT